MDPTGDATSRSNNDGRGGADRSAASGREVEYDTVTKRVRRGPGGWWWLAVLAVPLLIAALATLITRGGVQDDLRTASRKALESQGIKGADVDFEGRDGTITLPAGVDAGRAEKVVEGVDGVRVAEVKGGAAGAAPTASPTQSATPTEPATPSQTSAAPSPTSSEAAASGPFTVRNDGETVVVEGTVPDAAAKKEVVDAATRAAGGKQVVDRVTVEAGAAEPDAAKVGSVTGALGQAPDGVQVRYDGKAVTLTGEVPDEATRSAAATQATQVFPGATVANKLTVKGAAAPADCGRINATVRALVQDDNPRFPDNSTVLVAASRPTLDKVADAIKACPDARVQVAGHTDDTGTPGNNQRLSQGRAAAVRTYLSGKGVNAASITATGFGQARPVAPNTTAAGRDANRRVEITVQGG